MSAWVSLSGGTAWALQLDGIIYRVGYVPTIFFGGGSLDPRLCVFRTGGGNMFMIEHTTDFELYSSASEGAIQGYGYTFHECELLQAFRRLSTPMVMCMTLFL